MSDMEPELRPKDRVLDNPDMHGANKAFARFATRHEREAVAFSELFAADDDRRQDRYYFACVSRGLNPDTQEPWTEAEAAEFKEQIGFDPLDIVTWVKISEAEAKYGDEEGYQYGNEEE